jgi:streptogramin lyase
MLPRRFQSRTRASFVIFAILLSGCGGGLRATPVAPSQAGFANAALQRSAPTESELEALPETAAECRGKLDSKYDPNTATVAVTGALQGVTFPCFGDVTSYLVLPANHEHGASIAVASSSDKPLGGVAAATCVTGRTSAPCGEPLFYASFEPSKNLTFTAGASARIAEAFTSPSRIFNGYTYAMSVYVPKLRRTVQAVGGLQSSATFPHRIDFGIAQTTGTFTATPMVVIVYRQKLPAHSVTYYDLPPKSEFSLLEGITVGSDGNLWFADEANNSEIGKITTAGKITLYPVTTDDVTSYISAGPDGNVWFATQSRIGRITPAGAVAQFDLPDRFSQPGQIATGPDGNLWFPNNTGGTCVPNKVARSTTRGGVGDFDIPTPCAAPAGMAAGADGNMWFGEQVGKIARVTPAGAIKEFTLRSGAHPGWLTAGPDGNVWFTDVALPGVGRITPAGTVTEFSFGQGNTVVEMAAGPDGNLWVTGGESGQMYSVTTSGKMTLYQPPADGNNLPKPIGVVAGPDGNIWFTDLNNGVGKFTL